MASRCSPPTNYECAPQTGARPFWLLKCAAEIARRASGDLAEGRGESVAVAETKPKADLGHRQREIRQRAFGALDAPVDVGTVRRRTERPPAGAGEAIGAELREPGGRRQCDLAGEVLLDIIGDAFLLPGREPAIGDRLSRLLRIHRKWPLASAPESKIARKAL